MSCKKKKLYFLNSHLLNAIITKELFSWQFIHHFKLNYTKKLSFGTNGIIMVTILKIPLFVCATSIKLYRNVRNHDLKGRLYTRQHTDILKISRVYHIQANRCPLDGWYCPVQSRRIDRCQNIPPMSCGAIFIKFLGNYRMKGVGKKPWMKSNCACAIGEFTFLGYSK